MRRAVLLMALLVATATPLTGRADAAAGARFYEEGVALYRNQDFARALKAFRAAYAEDPSPNLLFNVAQCEFKLGNDEVAIAAYSEYLAKWPDADNRREVVQRIEELRARQAAARPAPAPSPAPAPPIIIDASNQLDGPTGITPPQDNQRAAPPGRVAFVLGGIAALATVASVGAGLGLAIKALQTERELSSADIYDPGADSDLQERVKTYRRCFGGGAASAALSLAFFMIGRHQRLARASIQADLGPARIGLSARGTF
jgi:tetratricopeptide (TPR) repeat protein